MVMPFSTTGMIYSFPLSHHDTYVKIHINVKIAGTGALP